MKKIIFPPATEIRAMLEQLRYPEVQELCKACGVPLTTVWKIRQGETRDPGIETVRLFWLALQKAVKAKQAGKAD